MLKVQVLCTGKLKERFYKDAAAEYQKRLGSLCQLTVTELNEVRLPEHPSPAQIEAALSKERDALLSHLPRSGRVIALCIEGKLLSSEALSHRLSEYSLGGVSAVTFLIGSSYGLHPDLKARADLCLSMSPMTFPHHLARIMLLEQIYRAFLIQAGSPYHK